VCLKDYATVFCFIAAVPVVYKVLQLFGVAKIDVMAIVASTN
jgi:hypothetical protein